MGINYGLDKVRFPSPVPVGARIRLAARVAGVDEVANGGVQLALDFTVEIDGAAKPACVARVIYRQYA
jgi:acyl dehydratase